MMNVKTVKIFQGNDIYTIGKKSVVRTVTIM